VVTVTTDVTFNSKDVVNTRRELRRLTILPDFEVIVNATIVKLISNDLSSSQTIKDVKTISADFLGGQLKLLFETVLHEVCVGECVAQLTNSTLGSSVRSTITNALTSGEFVQTMQNVADELIPYNPSLESSTTVQRHLQGGLAKY
jgi:hypothetical protein